MSTNDTGGRTWFPNDPTLPLFTYGLFQPGEIAFFQIADYVETAKFPVSLPRHHLLLRDGLPLVDAAPEGNYVEGALIWFIPDQSEIAYGRIAGMEPKHQYRWSEAVVADTRVNLLIGKSPSKGNPYPPENVWSGWKDPLFSAALDVVEETLESERFDWNHKPLFRLQMAYLLLWTSIERYLSVRYRLGKGGEAGVRQLVSRLAEEPAFAKILALTAPERRVVHRSDKPGEKEILDPQDPAKSVDYYYQVRSNITHRGKAMYQDFETVQTCLRELLTFFRDVLAAAQKEAERRRSELANT